MSFQLSEEQLKQFEEDGFVLGGPLISEDQADTLINEVMRVVEDQKDENQRQPLRIENINAKCPEQPVWQIVNIWQASPDFKKLMEIDGLAETASKLLQAQEIRVWHDQIQFKPKEIGGENSWHQDWPYWPPLSEPNQVTAWVALEDADEENGCMSMVKGSHKWGKKIDYLHEIKAIDEMPKTFEGRNIETVRCPVKKGHVHFHHALTWHGSKPNTSNRPRRAIAIHFMGEKTKYKVNDLRHPCERIVPKEVKNGDKLHGDFFPLLYPAVLNTI